MVDWLSYKHTYDYYYYYNACVYTYIYTRNIRVKECGPRSSSISINPVGSSHGGGTQASLPETMDPANTCARGIARAE